MLCCCCCFCLFFFAATQSPGAKIDLEESAVTKQYNEKFPRLHIARTHTNQKLIVNIQTSKARNQPTYRGKERKRKAAEAAARQRKRKERNVYLP